MRTEDGIRGKELNLETLKSVVAGACLLGSGGGGGYGTAMQLVENFDDDYYRTAGKLYPEFNDIISPEEAKTLDYGLIVAYMGAPEKFKKLKFPDAAVAAVTKIMDKYPNKKFCIVPVEIGPVNTVTPCLTAYKLGIPVVDADGAGRAVPTLDLISFSTKGLSVNPTVLVSQDNPDTTIELTISNPTSPTACSLIESFARPTLDMAEFDGMAALSMWLMKAEDISGMVIPGTLNMCSELGALIRKCKEHNKVSETVIDYFKKDPCKNGDYKAECICRGKLKAAEMTTGGGFDQGKVKITGDNSAEYTAVFQNESLILWSSDMESPVAMAPDLISFIVDDKKEQWVFTNDDLMENGSLCKELENRTISVVGLKAPARIRETNEYNIKLCTDLLRRNNAKPDQVTLPENYMRLLTRFGYYGKYSDYIPYDDEKNTL